jgi:hypothetical protein
MEDELSGRRLWQVAGAIRDQLHAIRMNRFRDAQSQVQSLSSDMTELESVRRRLNLCVARGWTAAAGSLMEQATRLFRTLNYGSLEAEKAVGKPEVTVPNIRDVLEELQQAEEEFEGLRYYPEDQILSIVTDAIELEGVFLGDFEVQLHIPALGDPSFRSIYRIVALDPHPSVRNEVVTHPHVNEERLCAGDAGAAIDAALAGGRVCDFFMLVRSVLTNYNRDSAYVTLEDWDGATCHDCGSVMGADETYYCTSCDYEFCSECSSCCDHCDETTCMGCLETCRVCEDHVCSGCMTTCSECGERLCRRCREEARCPCLDEDPENENEEESHDNDSVRTESAAEGGETVSAGINAGGDAEETAAAVGVEATEEGRGEDRAPVHPDRMGEVALLP